MLYPPFLPVLKATHAVTAIFGTNKLRIYGFGRASQNEALPYAVFQTASGLPENYLGQVPDMDAMTMQFDVYAANTEDATGGAKAIRDALEPIAYVTSWRGESRDPDTNHYRFSFDVDFLTSR